jgi:hypothetical protein
VSTQGASPEKFIADYGSTEFPHRDDLLSVLRDRSFREFYSSSELEGDRRPSLTCRHYADIYRFRTEMMAKRLPPSSELDERLRDFRHLYTTLDRSPDEPCQLYLCIMADLHYAIFCRPTLHDVAGCFVSRPYPGDFTKT